MMITGLLLRSSKPMAACNQPEYRSGCYVSTSTPARGVTANSADEIAAMAAIPQYKAAPETFKWKTPAEALDEAAIKGIMVDHASTSRSRFFRTNWR